MSRCSYKLRQWYPEGLRRRYDFISALWANVFIVTMTERLALSDAHFRRISQLIYNEPGSFWLTINATWFTTDWSSFAFAGTDGFRSLSELAGINQHSGEWQAFINSLTTNLTAFSVRHIISLCSRITHVAVLGVSRMERGGFDRRRAVQHCDTLADTLGTAPGRWKVFASDMTPKCWKKPEAVSIAMKS